MAMGLFLAARGSSGAARFVATPTRTVELGSSSVGVAFTVRDLGTAAGRPRCKVRVLAFISEDDSTYEGARHVVLPLSRPGGNEHESARDDKVVLSGPGASVVSAHTVKVACGPAT